MDNQLNQLAGATVSCPCDYCCLHGAADCQAMRTINNPCHCRGTGRVYLFPDEVRVPCNQDHFHWASIVAPYQVTDTCEQAGCRGWAAATDGWVWWLAVVHNPNFTIQLHTITPAGYEHRTFMAILYHAPLPWEQCINDDPKVAFFTALTRAVEQILDVELGSV